MSKLIIIDHTLTDVGGHHFTYNRSIADAALARGMSVVVGANKRCVLPRGGDGRERVIPAFDAFWYSDDTDPASFARDIWMFLQAARFEGADHCLIHSLGLLDFVGVLAYLTNHWDGQGTFHVLCRRDWREFEDHAASLVVRSLLHELESRPELQRGLRFYTDTERLTDQYRRLSAIPFTTAPIPFSRELHEAVAAAAKVPLGERRPLTIAYFGDARREKGFHLLPEAIRHVRDTLGAGSAVRFFIQGNFNVPGGEPGIAQARRALEGLEGVEIEVTRVALGPETYAQRLAESDIVVIPYEHDRYAFRSSGVFVEAAAAGKVPVVPANSWMGMASGQTGAVRYAYARELGAAIVRAIEGYDGYARAAQEHAPLWRASATGAAFLEFLLAGDRPSAGAQLPAIAGFKNAPVALVVLDAGAQLNRNGASRTQSAQLDYLTRAGCDIYVLGYTSQYGLDLRTARRTLLDELARFSIRGLWLSWFPWIEGNRRLSFSHSRRTIAQGAAPAEMLRDVPFDRVSLIWTNYAAAADLTQQLKARCRPDVLSVVEMHDLVSHGNTDKVGRLPDFLHELGTLRGFDVRISVSEAEAAIVREAGMGVTLATPYSQVEPPRLEDLAGCCDVAEVLHACGSSLPSVNYNLAWSHRETTQILRLQKESALDILLVASDTDANAAALRWFVEDCYPLIAGRPNIVVAGSLWNRREAFRHERLFWAGLVDSLRPLYAAARVIIAPVISGTGVKIKVIEMLALGKPFVATRESLAGLPDELETLGCDGATSFARRVSDLLRSRSARVEAAAQASGLATRVSNQRSYLGTVDAPIRAHWGDSWPLLAIPDEAQAAPTLIEFDEEIRAMNQACAVAALVSVEEAVGRLDFTAMPAGLFDRRINDLRAIFESLYVRRDAPIVRADYERYRTAPRHASATQFIEDLRDAQRIAFK